MIRPDRISLLLFSLLLAACGGGDGESVVPEGTGDEEETEVGEETGGLIDQDSFDISVSVFNPGAADLNGATVDVTVHAGDRLQNPVPDGTVIYFNAESGIIAPSCETADGSCTVTWTSSGYRPGQEAQADYDGLERVNEQNLFTGSSAFGLTTIMAYAVGEAGFTDTNDNGVYDVGEPFEAFGEPFRDDNAMDVSLLGTAAELDTNANGSPVEYFADYNLNGLWDEAPDTYQGSQCSDAARAEGHCSSLMYVRDSIVISQAVRDSIIEELYLWNGSEFVSWNGNLDINGDGDFTNDSGTFYLFMTDSNSAMPETGTNVSVTGSGYAVGGLSGDVDDSVGLQPTSYAGLSSSYGSLFNISFVAEDSPDSVDITINSGTGGYTRTFSLVPFIE